MSGFSETVMDHFQSPRNCGRMETPDVVGVGGVPGRGPHLVLYLRIDGERVTEANFQCHGCGATIAAGSMLTEMIVGRPITECQTITPNDLLEALDGLPPHKRLSPHLAIAALQQALGEIERSDVTNSSDGVSI